MSLGLSLITDAASEPLSLSEAKAHLSIDSGDTAQDSLITALIKAARKFCENYTNLALINQTWDLWLDQFPTGRAGKSPECSDWWDGVREGSIISFCEGTGVIEVPKAPLSSITSLTTYGLDNSPAVFDTDLLIADKATIPGRIFLVQGSSWPSDLRSYHGIQLRFVAGYGATSASVPQDIIQACFLMLTHLFENRGESTADIPMAIKILLDPYKVRSL